MSSKEPNPLPKGLWQGEVAFILGGGPSLAAVDLSQIHQRKIIAVNNSYGDPVKHPTKRTKGLAHTVKYEPRPWVDVVWFGDGHWFEWHEKDLRRFRGLVCTCAPRYGGFKGIYWYERKSSSTLCSKNGEVSWNGNSGSSAINFAYHLGVRRVVLLGFDMKRIDGKTNWHEDHPAPEKNPYPRYRRFFPNIAKSAKRLGLNIINCTPGSKLEEFPIMSLEEYLQWEEEHEGRHRGDESTGGSRDCLPEG